jgi:hypothetical protein
LELNSGKNPKPGYEDANGTSKPEFINNLSNNELKYSGAKITIWEGKLRESIVNGTKSKGLTLDQAIAATGSHEIEHAVGETNIALQENKANESDQAEKARLTREIEVEPNKIGDEVREEFRNRPKLMEPITLIHL